MSPRGPELSPQERSRICELHSINRWGAVRIHRVHSEFKISTIKYTIRKERERERNQSLSRSGRSRKLTEEQRDLVYDLTRLNPHIKLRELVMEVDHTVAIRTMRRLLKEMGRRKWKRLKRPELKPIHAVKRLIWAQTWAHLTPEQWARVKWSDECSVERGAGTETVWTFNRPSEQLELGDVSTERTGKSVKQMFWAGFGENMRTELIAVDGDPESARGGVTGAIIHDLYRTQLPLLLRDGDIFMHDGASVHRAVIVKKLLTELRIEVMDWPPYSPDLNPIENLWAIMKREIYRLHPELEHADDTETTRQQLIIAAKEAWRSIDHEILYNLSITMPNRVQAVINADGWYTKY